MNFQNAEFIKSAASPSGFINDGLPQIVFAGRSNVGKSSVINTLLGRKNFARAGASPGKTAHINYFLIDRRAYFVDLPGYGYAKVTKAEKERWGRLLEQYFKRPEQVTLGILIVDSRHKPSEDDLVMYEWFINAGRPLIIIANKVDKLKKSEIEPNMRLIRDTMAADGNVGIIPFSAVKGISRDALTKEIILYTGA